MFDSPNIGREVPVRLSGSKGQIGIVGISRGNTGADEEDPSQSNTLSIVRMLLTQPVIGSRSYRRHGRGCYTNTSWSVLDVHLSDVVELLTSKFMAQFISLL